MDCPFKIHIQKRFSYFQQNFKYFENINVTIYEQMKDFCEVEKRLKFSWIDQYIKFAH